MYPLYLPIKLIILGALETGFLLCEAGGFWGTEGIIGSTVFRMQDEPGYRPGIEAWMIANTLILVIVGLMSVQFWRANRRIEGRNRTYNEDPILAVKPSSTFHLHETVG